MPWMSIDGLLDAMDVYNAAMVFFRFFRDSRVVARDPRKVPS